MEHSPAMQASSALTLRVEGMDCGGCERKVESALGRLEGIEQVQASSVTGSVKIVPASQGSPNHETIERTLDELGYRVVPGDQRHQASDSPAPWWQTAKGRLVLVTGGLLALAFILRMTFPALGNWPFVAATVVGLVPIIKGAWGALKMRNPFTIEMLMSIAALGALAIDAAAEAAVVVFLFAVGELLEGVAASRARRSISALADLAPSTARLIDEQGTREVSASSLTPGQRVMIRPGDRVPCDGRILAGTSELDESPVNGESVPRTRSVDDEVLAGTVNLNAALEVEVTRGAEDNTIARVIRLVEEAQAAKAPVARFIDRFAYYYMPAVVGLALLMAVVPPLASSMAWSESIYRALALLLIACPCALVISTPAAIAAGLSAGARRGLLIKGGAVLEQLGKLRLVALDKTGTLTVGAPRVTDVADWTGEHGEHEVLRLAAAMEQDSSHPIARAILEHTQQQGLTLPRVSESRAVAGRGIAARVEGRELGLVPPHHLLDRGLLDDRQSEQVNALEEAGKSLAVLMEGERPLGLIAVRDEPRADAREGLAALSRLGVQAVMLSGDNVRTARAIGDSLGIEAHGKLMPEDKARHIRDWQAAGRGPIGKVGDGINDAPALASADVGIAMGGGTDVALETADAALLKNRVTGIAELIDLSRATLNNVKTNVALALGLKAIFLATTALGFTGMWIAVMADTGATVLVTLNAMRLLGYRFSPVQAPAVAQPAAAAS
ncbi:heavy metal translocating P-type ATPase [Halomonas icarae]|uniref:P-type Zn(2+) transporter n=1 Tax=Halomonas icarae TaxID=2691040 RepID=A0A7X4VYN1_9GAMM|nr:heavy metal translocating P-type ATPase [Halomonas icarae]MDR5901847.1 heavy metal translocating P-type ATPase [Halomonas icarae]NAW12655.1 cadmium-translocating P-type ATPase [Halomonas icarae]